MDKKRKNWGGNRSAAGSSLSDGAMQITLFFFSTSRDKRYLAVHYEQPRNEQIYLSIPMRTYSGPDRKRCSILWTKTLFHSLNKNVVPFSERKRIAFIRIIVDINCLKDEKTTVSYKWRCERVIKGPLRIGKSKRKYGLFIKQTTIRNVNEFLHARGNYLTRAGSQILLIFLIRLQRFVL